MESSGNNHKRRERTHSVANANKAKRQKQDPDGGPSKEALLHGAYAYLAKVKEAFHEQPSVYAEFTTLLRDFRDKRVAIPAVVSQVLRLFLGHEELLQGFNVFLPVSYHLAYAEEIRRHKARLAANAERSAFAEQGIPLHFLSALSPDPGVLHNHALSAGLPPGIIHWTAPEAYFNVRSSLLNPILTLDRIPLHIAAASPFSSGHAVTFFNTKLASDLHILDAITRGIEFWPLPVDYKARRSPLDGSKFAEPRPTSSAGLAHGTEDGAVSSSRSAAAASKAAGKALQPLLEGMVDVTDVDWGGSASQYRQSVRRRKLPHEAYVICDVWKTLPSDSDEADGAAGGPRRPGSRRQRMLQRQDVLSNPADHPAQARRCTQLLHQYRRPTADDAMELLFRAKESSGTDQQKYALLLRYLRKYFRAEMDAAKVYLGLLRLFKDHEDIQELLKPFFPGMETLGDMGDGDSGVPRLKEEPEDAPSCGHGPKRPSRRAAPATVKLEDEDYVVAEEGEEWDAAAERRPAKRRTQTVRRPQRTSPSSSELNFPAGNSPDLKSPEDDLDTPSEEASLPALPLDTAAALAELQAGLLASSPSDGVKEEDLPQSLRPDSPMALDAGTLLRLKVVQARTVLERVRELEAHNREKQKQPMGRLPAPRRSRQKVDMQRDREWDAYFAKRAVIWEALEEPCRQLFEEMFSTWKGEALLVDMYQGSVEACREAAAALRRQLALWEGAPAAPPSPTAAPPDAPAAPAISPPQPLLPVADPDSIDELTSGGSPVPEPALDLGFPALFPSPPAPGLP